MQKQYGVTPPISLAEPTKADEVLTETLIQSLKDLGQYESREEAQKREVVLGKINSICKEFVKDVSLKKNLPESIANEAGGRIFTFGSYRLGVHGAGADIDTLCVAPVHVDREDFFTVMFDLLKERPEITELTTVPDAYVPVIQFCFSDIPIDLLFARLNLPSISDALDLSDNNLLRNLDERCVRSLNGSRVTDEILRLVPSVPTFRTALRCIKVWAKKRAIYSNILGFFGGVAWAMIVARVCQLYPKALAGTVITKFFRIMQNWKWPQPVLLKPIEDGPLQVRIWNPRIYPQDKAHRMPIITPAYPSMCSTHNVTISTEKVMTGEFKRAADVMDKIVTGQSNWMELFEQDDFFTKYKYYLQIIASSNSQETQLKWSGLVESKLRQLVMKLELIENVELAHAYIKTFDISVDCADEKEAEDVAHGTNSRQSGTESTEIQKSNPDIEPASETKENLKPQTTHKVLSTTLYVGLVVAKKDPSKNGPRKLDISWPISEFIKIVKMWDSFDDTKMGIVVNFLKSSQLPAELFGEEGPPSKPSKKRLQIQQEPDADIAGAKKRKRSDSVEDAQLNADTVSAVSTFDNLIQDPQITQDPTGDTLESSIIATSDDIDEPRDALEIPPDVSEERFVFDVNLLKISSIQDKVSPRHQTGINVDLNKSEIKLKLIN